MNHKITLRGRSNRGLMQRQRGFSLIELMVALTLGLVIVGGVISIFVTNQQAFNTTAALGRVQENARISFEVMARETRQAGGNPCGTPIVNNLLNSPVSPFSDWTAGTVVGIAGSDDVTAIKSFGTSSTDRVNGTDAIMLRGSAIGFAASIQSHDIASASIKLNADNGSLKSPSIVIACDGISAVIAQVSGVTGSDTINFNTSTGTSPGNCSTPFTGSPPSPAVACATPVATALKPDGFVAPLSSSFWYIGYNSRGGKSLFRASVAGTDEIAENVVSMSIDYLFRTESTNSLDSDWVSASGVTDWKSTASRKVAAVRFTLQLETLGKIGTNQQAIARELIHVVNLRNRSN